jgi:hypothetical protein
VSASSRGLWSGDALLVGFLSEGSSKIPHFLSAVQITQHAPGTPSAEIRCAEGSSSRRRRCPVCFSFALRQGGGAYACHGALSAWSRCTYTTRTAARLPTAVKLPAEVSSTSHHTTTRTLVVPQLLRLPSASPTAHTHTASRPSPLRSEPRLREMHARCSLLTSPRCRRARSCLSRATPPRLTSAASGCCHRWKLLRPPPPPPLTPCRSSSPASR